MTLIATASTSENPASRAARPYTSAKPTADTAMPAESSRSCRRAARRSAGTGLAEEGLRAGPVADHEDGVLLEGVARRVEQALAALRGALPDPPALVRVEGCRLGLQGVGQALAARDQRGNPCGAIRLGLAGVRVVLADVRGHDPSALNRSRRQIGVSAACHRRAEGTTRGRRAAARLRLTGPPRARCSAGPRWRSASRPRRA